LIKGLAARNAPGYLIHTSGTGILSFADTDRKIFGEEAKKVYDDWDGIGEITTLPDHAPHRLVDKTVIGAHSDSPIVYSAIVCPPTIYGVGRGPGSKRGHQVNELARCTLERKQGVQVGTGKTRWPNIHVYDMSDCYLKLVEAAVQGGGKATWNQEGYYFTENGEHMWGDISKVVASAAHKQGLVPSAEVASISAEEANNLTRMGAALWGANSRCKAIRARKILGWAPKECTLNDECLDIVSSEARRLGLTTGHAAKVTA